MEPFNIKIVIADQTITLTILPIDHMFFKIVYFGGILGGIRQENDQNAWQSVPADELIAGDLPFYQKESNSDHVTVELDASTITQIGKAIEVEFSSRVATQNIVK